MQLYIKYKAFIKQIYYELGTGISKQETLKCIISASHVIWADHYVQTFSSVKLQTVF